MLTQEQQQMVSDNYKLIHGFCAKKHLNLDDWHGILAIELCKAVCKYEPERGALSTYFYMRAEHVMYKELEKMKREYYPSTEIIPTTGYEYKQHDVESEILIQDMFDGQDGLIMKLKYYGYTQSEIAKLLGKGQSHISKVLSRLRSEFNEY